ncbi:hypothetical protein O1M63_41110 [Streptomyces mirabilis]|nr:hypothetical protein [Streptomyces mirabilis]
MLVRPVPGRRRAPAADGRRGVAQLYVSLRFHMDAAEPAQFLVGHGTAAHPRTGVAGVHPQVDVADVGALEVRAVEAVQVPAGVEQHPGGAAGPRGGGEVGGPVLALLLGERVAGVFLNRPAARSRSSSCFFPGPS